MKKSFSKLTALTLALTCVTGVSLTGCSSTDASSSSAATTTAAATAATTADANAKPYALDMYYINYGSPLGNLNAVQDAMSKILTTEINATIVLHPIDSGAWTDKLNLMFSSGEKVDIIPSSAGLKPTYDASTQKGAYEPLDDLLTQYGKDIVEILGADYIKGTAIGGKIYGIPVNKEKGIQYGFLFNKALADKYKFDLTTIKTYEDLEPMLKTIKENEPDITPLCLSARNLETAKSTISPACENISTGLAVLPIDTKDYKLIYTAEYQPYLDLLDWGRQMYQNGYINKSSLTDTDEGPMKAGKAFCQPYELKPGKAAELTLSWGYEIAQVELTKAIMPATQAQGIMTSIGNTSEDPARAMQFINLLFTNKELLNTLIYGIEGTDYVKVSDNIIDYPTGVTSKTVSYANQGWLFGNQFNNYLRVTEDPQKWANFEKFNETVVASPILGFSFDSTSVKTELAAIATVKTEYDKALWTGSVDPKTAVPEFLAKIKAAGSDTVMKAAQDQLDAWVKANIK